MSTTYPRLIQLTCYIEYQILMPGTGARQVTAEDASISLLGSPDDEHGESTVVWSVDPVSLVWVHHLLAGGYHLGFVPIFFLGVFSHPVYL